MKTGMKATIALLAVVAFAHTIHAQYEGVRFDSGSLAGHDFTGMDLSGATFTYVTDVTGASFADAKVWATSFSGTVAKGFTQEMLKSTADYKSGRLYVGLYSDNLQGWDLSGMDLTGSLLGYSNPANAHSGLDLSGSIINDVWLDKMNYLGFTPDQLYATASYQNKNLTGVDFSTSQFVSADGSVVYNFTGQDLTNANLWGAYFTSSDGSVSADFTNAIIKGANFSSSSRHFNNGYHEGRITKEQIYSTASYKTGDLQGVGFAGNDLEGWDFSSSNGVTKDLTGADFSKSSVRTTDFTGAIIKDANFNWDYNNNGFTTKENYATGGLSKEQLYSTKSYQDKDLGAIDLSGAMQYNPGVNPVNVRRDLTDWDFSGQNLEGASFADAAISGASNSADFTGAVIKGANFSSTFEFAESGDVSNRNGLTFAQLKSTASWGSGELQGVSFGGLDLAAWDFSGGDGVVKNLTGASFAKAKLGTTNFTDAIVKDANFSSTVKYGFTADQFYSTASYKNNDLGAVWLENNDLSGWNFADKNLTGASFSSSTLTGADFSGATVLGATLDSTGFLSSQLYSTKSYADKDLRGTYLNFSKLRDSDTSAVVDMTGQNLQNTNIRGDLTNVDFTNADLRGAFTQAATGGTAAAAIYKNTVWSDGVVKGFELDSAGDVLVVKNYTPYLENKYNPTTGDVVITTKISDANVVMTGGELVIETGAPLALVQHKSLTADGGMIRMNYGSDGFGVINVYGSELGKSEFIITDNTEYYIDFGVFGISSDEYLMVDASFGGTIVGSVDDISFTVMDNGTDVSADWEFKIVDNRLYIGLTTVVPEPSAYAVVFGIMALAAAKFRRRK